jgi:glucokinase
MPKMRYAIGVDLGGTFIKIGIVNEKGKILKKVEIETKAKEGPKEVVKQIHKGIRLILTNCKFKIEGIGIGSPGMVNSKKGTVENPPNFPGWKKVNLKKDITKEFGLPTEIENDANDAAIGELIYGAGKKFRSFIMITLGTGVGGGIIFNKRIYRGDSGAAGEIGHTTINYNGEPCKCGSVGCIETYLGNNYLIQRIKKDLKRHPKSAVLKLVDGDSKKITPRIIHEASLLGDMFAKSVIIDAGTKLGYGLASVVNVLDIANIVVGGGVAGFGQLLFEALEQSIKERVLIPIKPRVTVKPAKLKNEAGIKGASALVFYKS